MSAAAGGRDLPETLVTAAAEALYALLPAHVRHADLTGNGALRALFDAFGLASAELDAELGDWYDALFVETAGEAGLAALAALVATPALKRSPGDDGTGQRAFVANTLRYRRGKGTARVLESMAADATGLAAVAVEYYQRLACCASLLAVRPDRPATALLVPGGTLAAAGSAFDRLPRLLDVRPVAAARPGRPAGRHAPTSVGVHLLRPGAIPFPAPPVEDPQAVPAADLAGVPLARAWTTAPAPRPGFFQLAQQPGEVVRLFNPDRRSDATGRSDAGGVDGGRVDRVDLPDRLRRLPLHEETAQLRAAQAEGRHPSQRSRRWFSPASAAPFTVFLRRAGQATFRRVAPEQLRIVNFETFPAPAGARPAGQVTHRWFEPGDTGATARSAVAEIACAIDPVTGRVAVPDPGAGPDVAEVRVACATGAGLPIGAGAVDRNTPDLLFDVRETGGPGDLVWIVDPTAAAGGDPQAGGRFVASLALALGEVAARGAGRRSLVLLARCDLEGAPGAAATMDLTVPPASEVHLIAAQWRPPRHAPGVDADLGLRGFVVRRERRFTVDAPLRVLRGPGDATAPSGRLVLDGLELTRGLLLGDRSVAEFDARYVTVRSPGTVAVAAQASLVGARLSFERCVCGPVRLGPAAAGGAGVTGRLCVTGSVLTSDGDPSEALTAPQLDVELREVTVLGPSSMRSLSATDVVFAAPVTVTRRQSGCVRYSFVPAGSAVPRTFRCQPALALAAARDAAGRALTVDEADTVRLGAEPVFLDLDPAEPTFAMLHPLCPDGIRSGGEDDAEMGVFARAAFGVAVSNTRALFEEFLPVALEAAVIDDTRSGAVSARRSRP